MWPNNSIFTNRLYVKNNKASHGSLKVGNTVPNLSIYDGTNDNNNINPIQLPSLLQHKYSIILAGSQT
jgi:hypothetical protein